MKTKYGLYPHISIKGKKIYYFWYYPDLNSSKRLVRSTGKDKKWEAKIYVENFLQSLIDKQQENINTKLNITLNEFTADFFIWDKCDWIKSQHGKGKAFDISVAKMRRAHLKNYILPEFGNEVFNNIDTENTKLTTVNIEKWLLNLSLSNQTKNHILFTFRIVMRWAKKNKLIKYNPLEDTEQFSRANYQKKDALSLEELKELIPDNVDELVQIWGSLYFATLFLLLSTTGMRSQEVRALFWGDIIWEKGIICIERAVKLHGLIGTTKSNYEKATFLPDRTIEMLKCWRQESAFPHDQSLIFYGKDEYTPLSRKKIGDVLQERLKLLPDTHPVRTSGKLITPHCFRTTYNTLMRKVIPENMLRLQLGHKSIAMTDRYDRAKMIEKILPSVACP